jgi:hypothetical protein
LDHAVFERFLVPAAKPDDSLLLVEMPDLDPADRTSTRFRAKIGQALADIARRRAARVVIDIQIEAGGGPLNDVVKGLDDLYAANTSVFLVADPDAGADTLAPEVYRHRGVAGVGHSRLRLDGALGVFKPVEDATVGMVRKSLKFLPLLVVDIDSEALKGYQVFATPALVADSGLGIPLERLNESLPGKTVILASSQRECRVHNTGTDLRDDDKSLCRGPAGSREWSGPDLLIWSLTDLVQRDQQRIRKPVQEGAWILAVALVCAGIGIVTHAMAVRWAGRGWSPTVLCARLPAVSAGAWATVVVMLALIESLLLHLGWLMPPTFPLIALTLSMVICHWHMREHFGAMLASFNRRSADHELAADYDVFVSYSHSTGHGAWVDSEIVAPLRTLRLSDGRALRVFFDRDEIRVGEQWFSRINLSILGSRCFLCVWSEDYLERDYCRWELDFAYPRAARPDFLFLPVSRLGPNGLADPRYEQYLQARQFIDAFQRPDFFAELGDAVLRHLDRQPMSATRAAA